MVRQNVGKYSRHGASGKYLRPNMAHMEHIIYFVLVVCFEHPPKPPTASNIHASCGFLSGTIGVAAKTMTIVKLFEDNVK